MKRFRETPGFMKNQKPMDSEHPIRQEETEEDSRDCSSDTCDVLQPSWVRCPVCAGDNVDKIILDYGFDFLLPVGILFWTIFLVLQ